MDHSSLAQICEDLSFFTGDSLYLFFAIGVFIAPASAVKYSKGVLLDLGQGTYFAKSEFAPSLLFFPLLKLLCGFSRLEAIFSRSIWVCKVIRHFAVMAVVQG